MNHTDYRGSCPHTGLIGSKVSQTAEKSRYRRIFSKALSLFLLLTAALLFTACTSDSDKNGEPPSSPVYSAENEENNSAENEGSYKISSLDDFKTAASAYGTVSEMTGQLTYESAVVTDNDKFNIIYMKTPSSDEARRILFEESAKSPDSSASPYITTLRSGVNFDYYEENVPEGASDAEPFYGYYLRVDGMLLLVTGAPEDRNAVKSTAGKLFEGLGYPAE